MMNKFVYKLIGLIDKAINIVVAILLLLFIIFSGYAIYDSYYVYNGAKLSDDIKKLAPDEEDFSLASLQDINPDICAWLKIDDTNIDYPVVQGQDNSYYLDRDYKKNYAVSGSVFLDYRNDKNFKDDYNIMYAHNLKTDLMFSNIKKFENIDFFNAHSSGILYTNEGMFKINILYFTKVNGFSSNVYNLGRINNEKNEEILNRFEENSIRKRDLEVTKDNKLLLLSTCDAAGTNDRAVLLCKLTKTNIKTKVIDSSLREIDRQGQEKNENKRLNDTIAPRQTVRVANTTISARTIWLIILSIIVIVIFGILFIQKIKANKKKNSNDEHDNKIKLDKLNYNDIDKEEKKNEIFNSIEEDSEILGKYKNSIKVEKNRRKFKIGFWTKGRRMK